MKIKKLLLALAVIPLAGCDIKNYDAKPIEPEEKMVIRKLTTGTDNDNHPYQTFSYTVTPYNAYYTVVESSITFADDRNDGDQYLVSSVDFVNKTCTVTCLQAFDSVATLTLSAAVGGATASVSIHYQKKRTGVSTDNVEVTLNGSVGIDMDNDLLIQDHNKSLHYYVLSGITTTKTIGTDDCSDYTFNFGDSSNGKWITSNDVYYGGVPAAGITASGSWASQGSYAQTIMSDIMGAFSDLNLSTVGYAGDTYAMHSSNMTGIANPGTSIVAALNDVIAGWRATNAQNPKLHALTTLFDSNNRLTLTFHIHGTATTSENGPFSLNFYLTVHIKDYWELTDRPAINNMAPESDTLTF